MGEQRATTHAGRGHGAPEERSGGRPRVEPLRLQQALLPRRGEGSRGPFTLLYGSAVVYTLSLYAVSVLLAQGDPLVVVDGGNAFDPYVVAEAARWLAQRPEALLGRVHISRAFTCHQLEALVTGGLDAALRRFGSRSLMLVGLLDTLYDEDVPHAEARQLFGRIAATLRALRTNGVSMVALCREAQAPVPQRRAFLAALRSEADRVIRATTSDGRALLITEKPAGRNGPPLLITGPLARRRRWR